MDPEIAWQDLVAAALLGTERRPFAPPSTTGPLGNLFGALAVREPERALLGTAAALSLFRRAGRRPIAEASPPIDPAEVDDRPRCSVVSDGHLSTMLSGTYLEVLPEWLAVLAEVGKRPPEATLPDLLDLGRSRANLRPAITSVIGPLGAWLAGQNPEWAYATGPRIESPTAEDDDAIETLWQTGTTESRTALLRRLRESRPDRARALVSSTWADDEPDDRASFLRTFATGLNLDDEPFLEAALDDRRKEVRSAAAALLTRLPGSALARRMIERVTPLIRPASIKGEILLKVTLPDDCDKAMVRDGIEPKFARLSLGGKAGWLSQMIARTPPSAWSPAWGLSPAQLTLAAVKNKWNDALYPALIEAAILHGDDEWIDALASYRRLAGKTFNIFAQIPTLRESTMLALIKAEDAEVRIRFQGDPLTEEQMNLLHRTPGPWGVELSRLVLERLARNLSDSNHFHYALGGFLPAAAIALPTASVLASPPRRTFPDAKVNDYLLQTIDRHLEQFHAVIQFRHEMTQELRR